MNEDKVAAEQGILYPSNLNDNIIINIIKKVFTSYNCRYKKFFNNDYIGRNIIV